MDDVRKTQDRLERIVKAKLRHEEITNLDDLIRVLQEIDNFNDRYLEDVPNTFGEVGDHLPPPIEYDALVSDLPSFGVEPNVRSINADTQDIWSHDNERLLVSNWLGERWRLAARKEWEGLEDQ